MRYQRVLMVGMTRGFDARRLRAVESAPSAAINNGLQVAASLKLTRT